MDQHVDALVHQSGSGRSTQPLTSPGDEHHAYVHGPTSADQFMKPRMTVMTKIGNHAAHTPF